MKVQLCRLLAIGGLGAIMAGVGGGALAQRPDGDFRHRDDTMIGDNHRMDHGDHMGRMDRMDHGGRMDRMDRGGFDVRSARRQIAILKMTYDHEIRSGHPAAAMRAHLRARAIRARLREHNYMD